MAYILPPQGDSPFFFGPNDKLHRPVPLVVGRMAGGEILADRLQLHLLIADAVGPQIRRHAVHSDLR